MQLGLSSGNPEYSLSKGILTVTQPVKFEIVKNSDDDKSKEKLFELSAVYILIYSLAEEISEELFLEYSKNNIPRLLHPYLRELISTSLTRVGMPPLTIPLFENI
jgi:preprotein translocase subunit SecB